jgi:hypothetical protein
MGDNARTEDRNLLAEDFKALGVTVEEMEGRVNITPEQEAAERGGECKGPIMSQQGDPTADLSEDKKDDDKADEGQPESYDLVPLTEELLEEILEEGIRRVKVKRGAKAKIKARKSHRYYIAHRAKIMRGGKKYRKKAVAKRKAKRRQKAHARFGGPRKGYRLASGMDDRMDLASRLRAELSESQAEDKANGFDDIELLETGALITAMLGDRFEGMGMEPDAETARSTSDNVMGLIERTEKENKVSVTDEEMLPAIKAIAVVIDHFEKLGEASNDLPLDR